MAQIGTDQWRMENPDKIGIFTFVEDTGSFRGTLKYEVDTPDGGGITTSDYRDVVDVLRKYGQ